VARAVPATTGAVSEPVFGVGEVLNAWVGGELHFERRDDAPRIALRAAESAGHEQHPEVAGPTRCDSRDVQWAEVAHIVGDDRPLLGARQVENLGVIELNVIGCRDGFNVVPALSKMLGDVGRQHLVEQELHRANAARPASQAA
jgi:hypothetical protein